MRAVTFRATSSPFCRPRAWEIQFAIAKTRQSFPNVKAISKASQSSLKVSIACASEIFIIGQSSSLMKLLASDLDILVMFFPPFIGAHRVKILVASPRGYRQDNLLIVIIAQLYIIFNLFFHFSLEYFTQKQIIFIILSNNYCNLLILNHKTKKQTLFRVCFSCYSASPPQIL